MHTARDSVAPPLGSSGSREGWLGVDQRTDEKL